MVIIIPPNSSFLIEGERVTCRGWKLTNSIGRTKLTLFPREITTFNLFESFFSGFELEGKVLFRLDLSVSLGFVAVNTEEAWRHWRVSWKQQPPFSLGPVIECLLTTSHAACVASSFDWQIWQMFRIFWVFPQSIPDLFHRHVESNPNGEVIVALFADSWFFVGA